MNVIIKRQKGMKMTTLAEGQSRDDALSLSEVKSFGQTAETPHNSAELWGGALPKKKLPSVLRDVIDDVC